MGVMRAILSVLIFSWQSVQGDAIFIKTKYNEVARTPSRTHAPSKGMVNANSAVQIASHNGLGGGTLVSTIKKSPLCRKEFPNLELWGGSDGDVCRTAGGQERSWSCPEGCIYASEEKPYCFQAGTRNVCTIDAAIHQRCGTGPCLEVCRYPHETLDYNSNDLSKNIGDHCTGRAQAWIAPQGCEVQRDSGAPYTWVSNSSLSVGESQSWGTGTVCHADAPQVMRNVPPGLAPDDTIRGMWRLVASSTHGAVVQLETGFTSSHSKSVTEAEVKSFSSTMSVGASLEVNSGDGAAVAKVESTSSSTKGGSSSIASTAESATGQSKTEMISVQCPDEQTQTTVGNAGDATILTSPTSLSLEYVYQWVVGNAKYSAKTQHFRCHRVADGVERDPQCPPQLCGDPNQNPYCRSSKGGQPGADPNCA